jgi:phosphoribosylglycinamide formyltransferase-1
MKKIAILISGRGSNLEAIVSAKPACEIAVVVSNRPDALGLKFAEKQNIPTEVVNHENFSSREAFDKALLETLKKYEPDLIVLAGFMRILTEKFINAYPRKVVNIHPSLLPAFTGLDTHQRAIDAGVRLHGCTVHFVTPELDHGPIIAQAAVPVLQEDNAESLAARVLEEEHRIYPMAIQWICEAECSISGNTVSLMGAAKDRGLSFYKC